MSTISSAYSILLHRSTTPRARFRLCAAALALLAGVCATSLLASSPHKRIAPDPWTHAVELRQKLEDSPAEQRTRDQYESVLDAFRAIYHQTPQASKAPAAVAAVADLLAEKGRLLNDAKALHAAIGQYEFLRQQYPNSPQVENALLLEGEICRKDLKDAGCAEQKFHAVLADKPGSSFAEQASLELKQMRSGSPSGAKSSAKSPEAHQKPAPSPETLASDSSTPTTAAAGRHKSPTGQSAPETSTPPSPTTPETGDAPALSVPAKIDASKPTTPSKIVIITGMRHWSNPTSTRIAIDLGGKVEYEAARVPNPERIFFDLHGAKLAPSLNGHQVEVVDDGFLKRIRAAQFHADVTRVVLDVTDVSQYSAFLLPNPWRLIIDIHSDKSSGKQTIAGSRPQPPGQSQPPPGKSPTAQVATESVVADVARLSSEPAKVQATAGPTSDPVSARVPGKASASDTGKTATVAEALPSGLAGLSAASTASGVSAANATSAPGSKSRRKGKNSATTAEAPPVPELPHAADPTADGQRSLVRALGLKVGRIVIDAGHGGHDSGTLGPGGIQEKDVVLDVALRVGKLLHQRLGAEIVYTRDDDTFIPLETRTAIANKAQADLFLSIHGNSSPEPSARGVETYYLNFTSDPNALDVAARENAVSSHSVHQLSDLVRKITLKDKIDESREFAADVDAGLYSGLKSGNPGLRDRGVKKAPFVVLIGAQMPSILAEISFLTNPDDAEQLREGTYRQRIAEALDAGVERYLRGLSGTRINEKSAAKNSAKNQPPAAGTESASR